MSAENTEDQNAQQINAEDQNEQQINAEDQNAQQRNAEDQNEQQRNTEDQTEQQRNAENQTEQQRNAEDHTEQQSNSEDQTKQHRNSEDQQETRTCYNCGKTGHVVPSCPIPRVRGRLPYAPQKSSAKAKKAKAESKLARVISCKNINGGNFYFR